jgi:hypothetical protein
MLKLKSNCAVCAAVQANPKLLNRIYNCSWFVPHSKDSLLAIANDCTGAFSYQSLKNHVKRHQFLNARDYTQKMMKLKAKEIEDKMAYKAVDSATIWDTAMAMGLERLKAGEMEIKTDHLLKAAKDKSDFQLKKSDQSLRLAEMVAHFASLENTNNERINETRKTITSQPPATVDSWQDQSGAFYQSLAGGAAAPGAG